MAEELTESPQKAGTHKNKRRRRRGGKPPRGEDKRTVLEAGAESAAIQSAEHHSDDSEAPRSGNRSGGQRRQRQGRGKQRNSPARHLSPNVIVTDADDSQSTVTPPPKPEDKNRYREIPEHWFDEPAEAPAPPEPVEMVDIVGVRFKDSGKVYYFAPMDYVCPEGIDVIVETARGIEYGTVSIANRQEPQSSLVAPLRPVVRLATDADRERHDKNTEREKEAFAICAQKIEEHGLDMKLVDVEYTFDNSKLTFYFSADGRVDFRELVKDLASVFRTRIELRQIGIRDEAKMLGGIGICGRPFCCNTFLYDFNQVSIRMAKEQNLSLNSAKISGTCGRLMCCLRYECEAYEEESKRTPRVDSIVKTKDGTGFVIESQPLTGKLKVKLGDADDAQIKEFTRDEVTVIGKRRGRDKQDDTSGDDSSDTRTENDTL